MSGAISALGTKRQTTSGTRPHILLNLNEDSPWYDRSASARRSRSWSPFEHPSSCLDDSLEVYNYGHGLDLNLGALVVYRYALSSWRLGITPSAWHVKHRGCVSLEHCRVDSSSSRMRAPPDSYSADGYMQSLAGIALSGHRLVLEGPFQPHAQPYILAEAPAHITVGRHT